MTSHSSSSFLLLATLVATSAAAQAPFRSSRHLVLPPVTTGYNVAAGDVDGDGDADLVVANDHDDNQLFLNDGRGRFVDATAGRLTTPSGGPGFSNATYALDLADIDGDGDLDLLLVNDHNLPNRVHRNNGAGVFTDVTATALPANNTWSVDQIVADFDGDGDVDWLVQNSGPPQLYLNNGAGVFTDVTATNLPANAGGASLNQSGCMAADLDQDGDLDALLPSPPGQTTILINQGGATFAAPPAGMLPPRLGRLHAADIDGDGRIDLIASYPPSLLRNLGGLTFAAPVPLPGSATLSLDFDEDGDLDLIGYQVVYRNDGAAGFATLPAPDLVFWLSIIAVADIDGDRDLDVVTNQRAIGNFLRQVQAPAAPAVGQLYTVEFHCPGDSPTVPILAAASLASAVIPIPGLGTLRLDPATTVTLPLMFATGGVARQAWTIPNNPAFVGAELDYQALVIDPRRTPVIGNAVQDFVQ